MKTFRKFGAVCAIGLLATVVTAARADALHGFCWGTSTCSDNGTDTPTTTNPPDFGFQHSGSSDLTGNLYLEFLIPTNQDSAPSAFSPTVKTGSTTTTATLFNTTAWSSGQLDSYLGISATGANPIGAYTGTNDAGDTSASAFYVYQDSLGKQTIGGTGGGTQLDLQLLSSLPEGSYILAFMNNGTDWLATANSGAILLDGPPTNPSPAPEPSTLFLIGTGLLGATGLARRRIAGIKA